MAEWPVWSPLLSERHMKTCLEFAKKLLKDSLTMKNEILWSDETQDWTVWPQGLVWRKPGTTHHLANTIPTVKHGSSSIIWVFFNDRDWGTGQDWGKAEWSTKPKQCSSLETILWIYLSGPARALTWTQSNISGEIWKWLSTDSPHPVWEDLHSRMGENPQIQVCKVVVS